MKADLHFHPSFFSRGDKPHFTEFKTPSLEEILNAMGQKGMEILTITSCSTVSHIDTRWNKYAKEADNLGVEFSENSSENENGLFFEDYDRHSLYLLHGQEFKTDKGDINVIGAESRVPIENSNGNFYWMLSAAKDSGHNVIITIPHPSRGLKIDPTELEKLYREGKIDALESYDSLDTSYGNKVSSQINQTTGIPGIAVSDGHRIKDMGKSRIFIRDIRSKEQLTYENLTKQLKDKIRTRDFITTRDPSPLTSRILYLARLGNAILLPNY